MNISRIKTLVPSTSAIQPAIQSTRVSLFNDPDHLYRRMQLAEHQPKWLHHAYGPYDKSYEEHIEVGGIVEIYV